MITPEALAAIEARLKAATPGPWEWDGEILSSPDNDVYNHILSLFPKAEKNYRFIANAPTDLALLIAEVKRLEAERACDLDLMEKQAAEIEKLKEEILNLKDTPGGKRFYKLLTDYNEICDRLASAKKFLKEIEKALAEHKKPIARV